MLLSLNSPFAPPIPNLVPLPALTILLNGNTILPVAQTENLTGLLDFFLFLTLNPVHQQILLFLLSRNVQ